MCFSSKKGLKVQRNKQIRFLRALNDIEADMYINGWAAQSICLHSQLLRQLGAKQLKPGFGL